MLKRVLLLAALTVALTGQVQAQPAKITVRLPADAMLFIDGTRCPLTSDTRYFETAPLQAGRNYTYALKAEVVDGGKVVSLVKEVTFRAGEDVKADFGDRPAFLAAARRAAAPAPEAKPGAPLAGKALHVQGPPPRIVNVYLDKEGNLAYKTTTYKTVAEKIKVKVKDADGNEKEVEQIVTKQVPAESEVRLDGKTTRVFTGDGKPVDPAKLPELIKGPTPVLLSPDGQPLDPFYAQFLNADALIVVPPPPMPPA